MNKDALNSGDSDELEALFDSIVKANQAGAQAAPEPAPAAAQPEVAPAPEPAPAPAPPAKESKASKAAKAAKGKPEPVAEAPIAATDAAIGTAGDLPEPAHSMFTKIGQMTRQLHDTLRELGYDKALEKAASTIPDARDRLTYIANMTEQAANRALNAVDTAKPLQDRIETEAQQLEQRWNRMFNKELSVDEFKVLVQQTRAYLHSVPDATRGTNDQLLEIMMAQDFQDLTGQVIKKIVGMAQELEAQLFAFLVEFSPQSADKVKAEPEDGLANGPVIKPEGRSDVVTSQQQVDDLLDSLGF